MLIDSLDCTNDKLFITLQVRADNPGEEFYLGDQNYRFSFNTNVLSNPTIVQELDASAYISGGPGPAGFSFYSPHSMTGSLDTIVSYNLELQGGDGLYVTDTDYINVGVVSLDILDYNTPVCLRWHRDIPADFPNTYVGQNYVGALIPTIEGSYLDYYQDLSNACMNGSPVAANDTGTTPEDQAITICLPTNDSDPENTLDASSVSLLSSPPASEGTATLDVVTGCITFTPTADFNGTVTAFDYQICDMGMQIPSYHGDNNPNPIPAPDTGDPDLQTMPPACITATVNITVTPTNDAPVATDDTGSTPEDTPLNGDVSINDSDLDGDPLTATPVTQPTNGTLTLNANGTYTYTPDTDYNGADSFEYQICDNGSPALCNNAVVNITVTPANDAPVATDDTGSTPEDTPLNGDVSINDGDLDGDPLTATPVTQPTNGTLTLNANGTYTYTPDTDYNGADSFEYQICDNGSPALCDNAIVNITVTPANDAPVATDDTGSTPEDTPLNGDVSINDSDLDGDPLTATPVTQPTSGTLTLNPNGTYTYTPDTDYNGNDSFEYQICDNGSPALCNNAVVNITVTPANDAPVATDDTGSTPEDTPLNGDVLINDSDLDGDPLTATPVTQPTNGTLTLNANGTYTYTPDTDYNGNDSFEYQICDNGSPALCNNAVVNITVTPANDAPVATDDAGSTPEDTPLNGDVSINDSDLDGDPLTATPVTQPTNGTLTLNPNGTYTYTPDTDYNGNDSFEYQICDNGSPALCDNAVVNITVTPANDAPVATDDAGSTPEDTPLNGDVSINDGDLDGDPLTVNTTPVTSPANGNITLNANGAYMYVPNLNFFGSDSFEYQICDNGSPALCDNAIVNITVTSVNDAPVVTNDQATTNEATPVDINVLLNDSDTEDGTLAPCNVTISTAPTNGTVTFSLAPACVLTYTPNSGFSGNDTFEYQVCDSGGTCENAIVDVTVNQVCLNIDLKVWLEGGLSDLAGGYLPSMRADLSRVRYILPGQSNSTLPSGQPYNTTPWNYMGTEGPGWTDADYQNIEAANAGMGVVDWILVSFRTGLATSTTFQKAAALVFEDGSIVFADPCVLTVSAPSSIYIVIEHRNHMGVMSHIPATVSGGQISYDFRNQDSYTNVSFGQKQVAPGMYAMYAGDCDQISDVTSYDTNGNDKALWIAENGIFAQYLLTDLNLNGDITGADKILWFQNNGIASGVLR